MPSSDNFSLEDIGNLLELLDKHEVSEFRLERTNETIWLRRGAEVVTSDQQHAASAPIHQVFTSLPQQQSTQPVYDGAVAQPQQVQMPTAPIAADAAPSVEVSKGKEVQSPMVGTFYRRPAVDADPYVEVGDRVKKGDVLCIVEAMKLMNEIECEFSGTVVEVCLDDGQMVEYGEPLFRIEPS